MTATETPTLGQEAIDLKEKDAAADDLRLWSVTTILKCLKSEGLERWAITETAKAAVERQHAWRSLAEEDPAAAIKWLEDARFSRPKGQRTAAELGEAVHAACEDYALSGIRPTVDDEVRPFLEQFDKFLQEWQPEFLWTEATIYSPTYGYAGRADVGMKIDGVRLIVDYKTSRESFDKRGKPKTPYPEDALQLTGYRYAELAAVWRPRRFERYKRRYYLLSPTEQALAVPVPEVDGGAVLHLTPDHALLYPVRCDEAVYESFLYVLEAARWHFQLSKSVIGEPMSRPAKES